MSTERDGRRMLDVRTIEGEPFSEISAALDDLGERESLELVAGFEPVPLYDVLDARGFDHETEQVAPDEYRVVIEHR